jgi:phasin family protein
MVEKKAAKPAARTPEPKAPVAAPDAPEVAVAPAAVAKPAPAITGKAAGSAVFPALPGFLKDYDFSKLFRELKVPALPDMEAVLATHKRNLEALSDANRVALEGAQAVARRHLEIVQSTMTEMTDSMKSLSVTEAPASRAAKQAELLKHAYENAVSNTRELGDLIQRSNTEALQKLNHRFSEAMNELKALFNKL